MLSKDIGNFFYVSFKNSNQFKLVNLRLRYFIYLFMNDKFWFNENLKFLYRDYIIVLCIFNVCKNV